MRNKSEANPLILSPTCDEFLFLTWKRWTTGLFISFAAGLGVLSFTGGISLWLAGTAALTVLVVYHLVIASRYVVALPHLAILISALQYVFAAWVNLYYPPSDPSYDIGSQFPFYLSYAGLVVAATAIGWAVSVIGLRGIVRPISVAQPAVLAELDILLVVGVIGFIVQRVINVESLGFVLLLVSNLRFVGAFGRMVLHGSGWRWRILALLVVEACLAAGSTMFHDLLLWCLWTFLLWIYCYRPRPRVTIAVLAFGVLLLPALQEAKWRLRVGATGDGPAADYEESSDTDNSFRQGLTWLEYMGPSFVRTLTLRLHPDFIADTAVRFNQGWIVSRVMSFVPEFEPYAMGATLKEDAVGALIPRVLDPEKFRSGGGANMLLYAGIQMDGTTSMTLGYAGEMYANFGFLGGAIGCFAYALFFGLMFRFICNRAFNAPMWWCFIPYVFYTAVKAEDDIGHVLNWTVKASLLLGAIFVAFPHLRLELQGTKREVVRRRSIPQGTRTARSSDLSNAR